MLTEQDYKAAAELIDCEIAAIKAVTEVEGRGSGFFKDGSLLMLFEPHIFWKRLKFHNVDPARFTKGNEDILYPVWNTKPYPVSSKTRYEQLAKACTIHELAAYESCSWGMFQIMGFNAQKCGYGSAIEMARLFEMGEKHHLSGFCRYVLSVGLDDELKIKAWPQFARAYNGAQYHKNRYDIKLDAAYWKYKRG